MEDIKYVERLEFLRKNTILGPIALCKLAKFKGDLEKGVQTYYAHEGDWLDFDFSLLEKYEYDLRFVYWTYECIELWQIYNDGLSLDDFSLRVMDGQIGREKLRSKKKTRKKL